MNEVGYVRETTGVRYMGSIMVYASSSGPGVKICELFGNGLYPFDFTFTIPLGVVNIANNVATNRLVST